MMRDHSEQIDLGKSVAKPESPLMNREQRRKANQVQKKGSCQPRTVRYPAILNTMEIVKSGVTIQLKSDVDEVMNAITSAGTAMTQGNATDNNWSVLAGGVAMGKAIEKQGVVRGMSEHLAITDNALDAIYKRALATGAWKSPTLYAGEIVVIREFISLHGFQLRKLSNGEFRAAVGSADAIIRSTGCTANISRDLPEMPT
jgi:hypothetical protein